MHSLLGPNNMKIFIVQFPFGVAAFDENNGLVEKALFPKNAQEAAKSLLKTESGKISDEVSSLNFTSSKRRLRHVCF